MSLSYYRIDKTKWWEFIDDVRAHYLRHHPIIKQIDRMSINNKNIHNLYDELVSTHTSNKDEEFLSLKVFDSQPTNEYLFSQWTTKGLPKEIQERWGELLKTFQPDAWIEQEAQRRHYFQHAVLTKEDVWQIMFDRMQKKNQRKG